MTVGIASPMEKAKYDWYDFCISLVSLTSVDFVYSMPNFVISYGNQNSTYM